MLQNVSVSGADLNNVGDFTFRFNMGDEDVWVYFDFVATTNPAHSILVTVDPEAGGSALAGAYMAEEGDPVTVGYVPEAGYVLDEIEVYGATLVSIGGNTYECTMGTEDIYICFHLIPE